MLSKSATANWNSFRYDKHLTISFRNMCLYAMFKNELWQSFVLVHTSFFSNTFSLFSLYVSTINFNSKSAICVIPEETFLAHTYWYLNSTIMIEILLLTFCLGQHIHTCLVASCTMDLPILCTGIQDHLLPPSAKFKNTWGLDLHFPIRINVILLGAVKILVYIIHSVYYNSERTRTVRWRSIFYVNTI